MQRPHQQPIVYRTYIQNEHPWKLNQLQDAGNHVQEALLHIDNIEKRCSFWYARTKLLIEVSEPLLKHYVAARQKKYYTY